MTPARAGAHAAPLANKKTRQPVCPGSMNKHALAAPLLLSASCAVGQVKPSERLPAAELSYGGSIQAPGPRVDPVVGAWVRAAPVDGLDLTAEGWVEVPLLGEPVSGGAGGQARVHIAASDTTRVVFDGEAGWNRELAYEGPVDQLRLAFTPQIAHDVGATLYYGPRFVFTTNQGTRCETICVPTASDELPGMLSTGLRIGGEGVVGDTVRVAGAALDFGFHHGERGGHHQMFPFMSLSLYVGL